MAGTLGGTTYGVAKQVTIVPVRVLGCDGSGPISGIIAAINEVTAEHNERNSGPTVSPTVVNMSLGGGPSTSLDNAVRNSIAAGISYAIAAGNDDGAYSCSFSRASGGGGHGRGQQPGDRRGGALLNLGTCIDLFAPGVNTLSAFIGSNTDSRLLSGTSMAAPHVAGPMARYLQEVPTATPAQVRAALVDATTDGALTGVGAAPNRLLFADLSADPAPEPVATRSGFSSRHAAVAERCVFIESEKANYTISWMCRMLRAPVELLRLAHGDGVGLGGAPARARPGHHPALRGLPPDLGVPADCCRAGPGGPLRLGRVGRVDHAPARAAGRATSRLQVHHGAW